MNPQLSTQYDTHDDLGDKIDLLNHLAISLADTLKDPTGGETMDADTRNKIREETHDKLCNAIDALTNIANFFVNFSALFNIGSSSEIPAKQQSIGEKK